MWRGPVSVYRVAHFPDLVGRRVRSLDQVGPPLVQVSVSVLRLARGLALGAVGCHPKKERTLAWLLHPPCRPMTLPLANGAHTQETPVQARHL